MTVRTNARIAGLTLLVYIAVGITSMIIFGPATSGETITAKLSSMAGHQTTVSINILLNLIMSLSALTLGATLWALTREQDPHLAMLGMSCRFVEGVLGASSISGLLALNWLATGTGPTAPDAASASALGAYLLRNDVALSATFFAVGSTIFSFLLLRGHLIPNILAWIGVVASVILIVALPLQLTGWLKGMILNLIWIPMILFEIPVGLWFIFKGVNTPPVERSA